MGLFLHLYIKPDGIAPDTWESVYEESVVLLRAFPAPLMRMKRERIGSQSRIVYTSDIVCAADTQTEHWIVTGDLSSYRQAESFCLYRHLEEQLATRHTAVNNQHDVLWASPEGLDHGGGNGMDLFGDKTQGYPYHLALLAVAILFEVRFPDRCYLWGDVESVQIDRMSRWVHGILGTPTIAPVCMDGSRLFQRLTAIFADQRHAIARFRTIFRGSNEEQVETLIRCADTTAFLEDYVEELRRYSSLSQRGAMRLISSFLVATKDLRRLIDVVLQAERANLASLLSVLCDRYVTIPYQEREPLDVLTRSQRNLRTIDDALLGALTRFGGLPSAIDLYLDAAETLEIFCEYQPDRRVVFQQIIRDREQHCREELEKITATISATGDPEAQAVVTVPSADPLMSMNLPDDEESYILTQLSLQTPEFHHAESSAEQLGVQLRQIMSEHPDRFASEACRDYLEHIYAASHHNGFGLRETAWLAIDKEPKVEILRHLLALASIQHNESDFLHRRIHICESQYLWKYLTGTPGSIPSSARTFVGA